MSRLFAVLAPLAVLQMAAPAPASAAFMLVPICGQGAGRPMPVRLPLKNDAPGGGPCCKICHISMRKRTGAGTCCGDEDHGED